MPYDTYDTRYNIPGLSTALQTSRKKHSELALGVDKLPQVLREMLMAKEKMLPLLQGERRTAIEEQNTLAPKSRAEMVGKVNDPFLIEEQIARDESRLGSRLSSLQDMEKNRGQTIQDIISRAGAGYGTQVQAAKDATEAAQTDYATALQQAKDERSRSFEARFDDLKRREMEASIAATSRSNRGGGGGGGGASGDAASDYASLVASGQLTLAQVPAAQRTAVAQYISQNGVELLPTKARDSLSAVNAARGVLQQIKNYSGDVNSGVPGAQKISGLFASIGGKLGLGGSSSQASAALGDIRRGLVSTLSRGLGEKGVLTDYDIKRAQSLIPSPYDTKQEAQRKIGMLEGFFKDIEQRAYSVATGSPSSLGLNSGGSDPLGIR